MDWRSIDLVLLGVAAVLLVAVGGFVIYTIISVGLDRLRSAPNPRHESQRDPTV